MEKLKIFTALLVVSLAVPVFAGEVDDLKLDVQKLKERVTELTNTSPTQSRLLSVKPFAIGIPVGLYNEDVITGLDFSYTILNHIVIRLDAHFLFDQYRDNELKWTGIKSEKKYNPVLLPSIGIMGKSPMIFNTRVYGGIFFGITYQTNNKLGPFFQYKGLGGVELYTSKHQAFFFEAGGGAGIFKRKGVDYTRGVILTGGSRFYF